MKAAQKLLKRLPPHLMGRGPLIVAGLFVGAGLGRFVEGMVFDVIFQWYKSFSTRMLPSTMVNLRMHIFYTVVWTMFVAGLGVLWVIGKRRDFRWWERSFMGSLMAGWGLFNIIERVFHHRLFGFDRVVEYAVHISLWDTALFIIGIALLGGGWEFIHHGRRRFPREVIKSLSPIPLEPEAQEVVKASAHPPYLFNLGPQKGREAVDKAQAGPISKILVNIEDLVIPTNSSGQVKVRIMRPPHAPGLIRPIVYFHGAGWVFGNVGTHDRLIRELAVGTEAAVVFPTYSLSPEAKYPTAIEECFAVVKWVEDHGLEHGLDPKQIAVAGDSVGGNMAAAITLMAKERGGPNIQRQVLFYPVTDASFDTESYHQFATGYFLRRDAMMWFWDQYTTNPNDRNKITASPLRATLEQLRDLPPALVITAEADVLRDEGEAYANKLREAGVRVSAVRFQGIIHDFVMLNALAPTTAARGAMALAIDWLRNS